MALCSKWQKGKSLSAWIKAVKKQRAVNYVTLVCSLCVRHRQIVTKGLSAAHSIFVLLKHTYKPKQVKKLSLITSWVSVWTQSSYYWCLPKISLLFHLAGSSLCPYGLCSLISIFARLDLLITLLTPTTVSLVIVSQSIDVENENELVIKAFREEIKMKLSSRCQFLALKSHHFECIILLASFLSCILIQIV